MKARYVLAPQAALDLAGIWRYIEQQSSKTAANQVETAILDKILFLVANPGAGHRRQDLTPEDVKFLAVYSFLIVYRPETKPLQVVSIIHGRRDVQQVLKNRL